MSATIPSVSASDGAVFNPDDLNQVLSYNPDGTLNYIQVVYQGKTYRQTYTYTSGNLTGISRWVKQ